LLNKKRILIVTECFYPEEFKVNDIALSWKKSGYDVDVLTLIPTYPFGEVHKGYRNRFFQKSKYHDINIIRIFAVTGYRDNKFKKILKYINFMIFGSIIAIFIGRRYDYVFGFNLGSLTDMFPAILIRKLYKKPTMLWVQDIWPDSVYAYGFKKTKTLSVLLESFVRFIFHNVSAVAFSSKGFESKLKRYTFKGLSLKYAPNWADDLDMDFDHNFFTLSKASKVHFTFAGNVGKLQNLENIIKAFSLLSDKYKKKSQLNIIGDGSNLVNLKKISNNNINIIFHGKKLRKEMIMFYRASDFLIVSLIDEPIFSLTVPAKTQTYIAAEKPIFAAIKGEVADIVSDNNLGICVDPSSPTLIKKAFEKCIGMSKDERSKFTTNNKKLLKTIFNKENIINNLSRQLFGDNN
jgi:glycosyltransferase involved in cell wall biosynthesis